MGQMHRYLEELLGILERSSENPLIVCRKGGVFRVAVEEPDVRVVEPVQYAAQTENVPTFRQPNTVVRNRYAKRR